MNNDNDHIAMVFLASCWNERVQLGPWVNFAVKKFTSKKANDLDFIQLQSLKDDVKNISMEISTVEMIQTKLINQTDVLFDSRLKVLTKVLFIVLQC